MLKILLKENHELNKNKFKTFKRYKRNTLDKVRYIFIFKIQNSNTSKLLIAPMKIHFDLKLKIFHKLRKL